MTMHPLLLLLAIVSALAAQGAAAQPPVDRDPAARLKRADADGDGKVSREEFIKARTAESEAAFARLDADGNSTLDDKEIGAAAERMRPGRRPDGEGPRRPDGTGPDGERPPRRPDVDRPARRPDGERPPRPDGERPARPGAGRGGEEAFNRFDRDGDGRLTREEFMAGMARMREAGRDEGPGLPDRGGRGERGPEQGFRRPPEQD